MGPIIQILGLPQPAHHALQGLIHLALRPRGEPCLAAAAARARRLPAGALAKTFQRLARRGLLSARRGPGGGYALARAAERISVAQIVSASAEEGRAPRCLMEDRPCRRRRPCVLHHAAVRANAALRARMEAVTLADLASDDDRKKGRLR